jgi:hypothetical protein
MALYNNLYPHPNLPPGGKEQNLSPLVSRSLLGRIIRKRAKAIKNKTIFVTKILKCYIFIGLTQGNGVKFFPPVGGN